MCVCAVVKVKAAGGGVKTHHNHLLNLICCKVGHQCVMSYHIALRNATAAPVVQFHFKVQASYRFTQCCWSHGEVVLGISFFTVTRGDNG